MPVSSSNATIASAYRSEAGVALADGLLGRDVGGGAEYLPGHGQLVLHRHAGDPEVGDREPVALVEQQVARLDVAMHDAGVMRGVECAGGLAQPAQRGVVGDRAPLPQPVADRAAAHQLHHHEGAAVVLADIVDRHHVRMRREARGRSRLALEAQPRAVVLGQVGGEHLDRDGAVQDLVVRLPDAGHPAVRDVADDAVALGQGNASRAGRGRRDAYPSGPRHKPRPVWRDL